MAESLLRPDSAGSMPGGTTLADTVTGRPTPGAGNLDAAPETNSDAPGNPSITGPGMTGTLPTSGGKAVPDDATLEGRSNALDPSDMGGGDAGAPVAPPGTTDEGVAAPIISETGTGGSDDGGLPTGGLSAGTSGGNS